MTQMNLSMKQKQTNRLMVAKRVRLGGRMNSDFGISNCKLLYMELINTKSYYIAPGTIFNSL